MSFARVALTLRLCLLALAALAAAPVAIQAQSIPRGSPLNPLLTGGTEESEEETIEDAGGATPAPVLAPAFQPTQITENARESNLDIEQQVRAQENLLNQNLLLRAPPQPGEFEQYVSTVADHPILRYGQDLLLPASRDFATPATATVPPEYLLNIGDVVVMYLTGSMEGTVEREIDTNGNIFLPQIGSIRLAGVRYGNLRQTIFNAVGREYRFFNVSVGVRSLRGIRVYVTGLANNPGAFSMNSLSTMVNAVFQAGGPSAGGSFRSVKLYRNGREVADFDLYSLLREGGRVNDAVLQNEDVLFIPPAGEQIAVVGSVQQEAIYELKPGETMADALRLAGGPNALADPDRLILYRTDEEAVRGAQEIRAPQFAQNSPRGGDILHVLSRGSLVQPVARQSVMVRIEGEVNRPGDYNVAPNTPVTELLNLAGGPTERAFLYGTRLERHSVRLQQRESYAEAIEQLEFALASAPLIAGSSNSDARTAAQLASAREVLDLLRSREPDGRVVMNLTPASTGLPESLLLEHQDSLLIPPRPTTVGVFGAVYRPASFMLDDQPIELRDFIERAGGLQRAADLRRAFVVRANGDVLTRRDGMLDSPALPGDVIFVPLQTNSVDIWTRIRDITSIIFQLGVTAAAVNSIQ